MGCKFTCACGQRIEVSHEMFEVEFKCPKCSQSYLVEPESDEMRQEEGEDGKPSVDAVNRTRPSLPRFVNMERYHLQLKVKSALKTDLRDSAAS